MCDMQRVEQKRYSQCCPLLDYDVITFAASSYKCHTRQHILPQLNERLLIATDYTCGDFIDM